MKFRRYDRILVGTVILWSCVFNSDTLDAQDSGQYIYGKITANSGQTYEGFMRWESEEISWHDVFNANKTNEKHRKINNRQNSIWGDFDWSISSLWKDKYRGASHAFACRFGDIAYLHNRGNSKVDVELKNGAIINVDGGSNDIGAVIRMNDYELGLISIPWKNIEEVAFFQSKPNQNSQNGTLLYGTVKTKKGKEFKGFIEWDQDERIGSDILDGESRDGEQKIPLKNVVQIEKSRSGSEVLLKSGRSIHLYGSNDVGSGNRGIAIYQDKVGRLDIPWDHFQSLRFEESPAAPKYDQYPQPKALEGFVSLFNGDVFEGQIIFDLDEIWDLEFLDGDDDFVHYEIPFRNISRIIPKNKSYSLIYLKNGDELLLGETQDVSNSNDGLLIVNSKNEKPISIHWEDISEIVFK